MKNRILENMMETRRALELPAVGDVYLGRVMTIHKEWGLFVNFTGAKDINIPFSEAPTIPQKGEVVRLRCFGYDEEKGVPLFTLKDIDLSVQPRVEIDL